MELNFKNWKQWRRWMVENSLVNEAADDVGNRFHKMVTAEKMSRKRLRKLLMATCADKHDVDAYLNKMHASGCSYIDVWHYNMHHVVYLLNTACAYKLLKAIFADEPENNAEAEADKIAAYAGKELQDFENDKTLIDSYSEFKTSRDVNDARLAYLKESFVLKRDKNEVVEHLRDLSKVYLWYSYCEN